MILLLSDSLFDAADKAVPTTAGQQYGAQGGPSPILAKVHSTSRLKTEFEELEVVGKGGFGDVIKVISGNMPSLVFSVLASLHQ